MLISNWTWDKKDNEENSGCKIHSESEIPYQWDLSTAWIKQKKKKRKNLESLLNAVNTIYVYNMRVVPAKQKMNPPPKSSQDSYEPCESGPEAQP